MEDSMLLLKFVAAHYGFVILLGLISYIIGYRLTRRVDFDSLWEEVSVSVSLGLGIIAHLTLFLGLLRLLYPSVVLLALLGCVIACYPVLPELAQRIRVKLKATRARARMLLVGVFLAVSIPVLALPLYPPRAFDSTMYFLTSAKVYVQSHQLVVTPFLRLPVLPQLNEMLFTLALLLYDDIAAQVIQLLLLATLTAALIAFGRRNFSTQTGWWSAAILLGNPLVLWVGTVAYLDISLMLFTTMAAYTFWNWLGTRKLHWLILSGSFCGFAASAKYPGLFFPLIFGLITVYIAIRERKYLYPVYLSAMTFVVAAPWYLRNYYHTRNPIFPFLPQVFGYSFWNAEDVKGLVQDMQLYGVGKSIPALLSMPWHLAFNQQIFLAEARLSPIYFFAVPVIIWFSIKNTSIRKIALAGVAFLLFWSFSSQVLRFLLPAIPIMSVAAAASFDMLLGWIPLTRKLRSHWIVVVMVFVVPASLGWRYADVTLKANGPIPVTQEQRDNYLALQFPSYRAHKLLNSLKGQSYTLYSMQDENLAYFVDGVYKGDYFGPARYARIWDKLTDGQRLYSELKSMGADYFLVNNQRMKIDLPQDGFFRSHFKPVYEGGTIHLFELTDAAFERRLKNILQNPDFEVLRNGALEGWLLAGTPEIDSSGKQSFSGSAAVHCDQAGDVVYQTLPAEERGQYFFSGESRASEKGQTAKVQVNWFDAEGMLVREDFNVIELGGEWKHFEFSFEAPPRAVNARLYASPLDPSSVWFDKFSFGGIKYEAAP
jgi:4-amino-4-deoxy-L-arabinose transferase-like glycosyltransferase